MSTTTTTNAKSEPAIFLNNEHVTSIEIDYVQGHDSDGVETEYDLTIPDTSDYDQEDCSEIRVMATENKVTTLYLKDRKILVRKVLIVDAVTSVVVKYP